MKTSHRSFTFVLLTSIAVLTGACFHAEESSGASGDHLTAAPHDVSGTYTWPTPEGWSKDTIPFPLSYAPELVYSGIEELRFAPNFFDPKTEFYWSYSFAFVLEDVAELSAVDLSRDLTNYYAGLARANDPDHFDARAHLARIESTTTPHRYRGTLDTVDSFLDGRALHLNLDGETFACGRRRIVLVSLTPHLRDEAHAAVWNMLEEQRRTFACVGK